MFRIRIHTTFFNALILLEIHSNNTKYCFCIMQLVYMYEPWVNLLTLFILFRIFQEWRINSSQWNRDTQIARIQSGVVVV